MARSSIANPTDIEPLPLPVEQDRPAPPGASRIKSSSAPYRLHRHPHPRRADPIAWPPLPGAHIGVPRASGSAQDAATRVLLERLTQRLAAERWATRLQEALLSKLECMAEDPGFPRAVLKRFRDESAAHFEMLCEAIESLGGDPLAVDPDADRSGVSWRLIEDPSTSLARYLDALVVVVLANQAGWELLLSLAQASGQDALAQRCYLALQEEGEHVTCAKAWCGALALKALHAAA